MSYAMEAPEGFIDELIAQIERGQISIVEPGSPFELIEPASHHDINGNFFPRGTTMRAWRGGVGGRVGFKRQNEVRTYEKGCTPNRMGSPHTAPMGPMNPRRRKEAESVEEDEELPESPESPDDASSPNGIFGSLRCAVGSFFSSPAFRGYGICGRDALDSDSDEDIESDDEEEEEIFSDASDDDMDDFEEYSDCSDNDDGNDAFEDAEEEQYEDFMDVDEGLSFDFDANAENIENTAVSPLKPLPLPLLSPVIVEDTPAAVPAASKKAVIPLLSPVEADVSPAAVLRPLRPLNVRTPVAPRVNNNKNTTKLNNKNPSSFSFSVSFDDVASTPSEPANVADVTHKAAAEEPPTPPSSSALRYPKKSKSLGVSAAAAPTAGAETAPCNLSPRFAAHSADDEAVAVVNVESHKPSPNDTVLRPGRAATRRPRANRTAVPVLAGKRARSPTVELLDVEEVVECAAKRAKVTGEALSAPVAPAAAAAAAAPRSLKRGREEEACAGADVVEKELVEEAPAAKRRARRVAPTPTAAAAAPAPEVNAWAGRLRSKKTAAAAAAPVKSAAVRSVRKTAATKTAAPKKASKIEAAAVPNPWAGRLRARC